MNITAAELKQALTKLRPVKGDYYLVSQYGVSAQDSDVWVFVESPLTGLGDFSIAGKKLSSVIGRMSGNIEITKQEKSLVLKSAKARIELEIQPVKPVVLPKTSDKFITVPLSDFKKALAVAVASASVAKASPGGGVVQIQTHPLGLEEEEPRGYRITGTDLIVLTVSNVLFPVKHQIKSLLNLTAASVVQLMDGPALEIRETNTHMILSSGATTVYASKPVQTFPDFDGLLAAVPSARLKFSPANWLAGLRTVEPLIDKAADQGTIDLHLDSGVLQWSTVGVGSTAYDESEYEQVDPDPIFEPVTVSNLRLKAKPLSGFLSRAGEEATMGISGKKQPVRFESDGIVVLIMPAGKKEAK